MWARDFTTEQWIEIRTQLERAKMAGKKDWLANLDVRFTVDQLRHENIPAVIVDGYLIAFQLGAPWYSPKAVYLNECLVLRLGDRAGNFRVVPETLLRLARGIPQCVGICVGTALTRDDRLARVYQRFGFQPEAQSLFRRTG